MVNRKQTLGQKVWSYARNAALAGAILLPFSPKANANESILKFDRIAAVTENVGVPEADATLSLYGATSPHVHTAGLSGTFNATRALNLTTAFPVVVHASEGMRFDNKEEARYSEHSAGLTLGCDSENRLKDIANLRLTGLGDISYGQRRELAHRGLNGPVDLAIGNESFLKVGGSATGSFDALGGRFLVTSNGAVFVPVDGEYRVRDFNGDRCELELSGCNVGGGIVHVRPLPEFLEGASNWLGLEPKNLGVYLSATQSYSVVKRRLEGNANSGVVNVDSTNEGLRVRGEAGICWGDTAYQEAQWGSLTAVLDVTSGSSRLSSNFAGRQSVNVETYLAGFRVRQQFGKQGDWYFDGELLFDAKKGQAYVFAGVTKQF